MLNINGWEKIHCVNSSQKKGEVTSLKSNKLYYRAINITRDKEIFFISDEKEVNPSRVKKNP